jgi:hypothetical protein
MANKVQDEARRDQRRMLEDMCSSVWRRSVVLPARTTESVGQPQRGRISQLFRLPRQRTIRAELDGEDAERAVIVQRRR